MRTDPPFPDPPPRNATQAQVANGEVLYNRYCSRCHVFGRGTLPDLRRLDPAIHSIFNTIVLNGALAPLGMGRFDDVMSQADADAVHAYLIDQGWQLKAAMASSTPAP
jgi:quinohemoprotein ethanol dehydrogenase